MLHYRLTRLGRALSVMLLVTGCFLPIPDREGGSRSSSDGSSSSATLTGRPVPPKVGNAAWDFTLPTLQGEQVTLSDLRGKKVLLNFWATWCGPCQIEIPAMVELYDEMSGSGLEILAINLREDPQKVEPFVKDLGMNFPVLLDRSGKVAQAYYVRGIPTSIFVDEEGIIQIVHVGTLSEKMLRDYIKRMSQ